MGAADANAELVSDGDLDALVRHVDRLCAHGDWDALEDLRHRCRDAHLRGHQLWPIASLAEYRLALLGTPAAAAVVLTEGTGLWALGPLPEVAASTHHLADLAPHLAQGPAASVTVHECVARGEDATGVAGPGAPFAHLVGDDGVALAPQPWEPAYPVATYEPDRASFSSPPVVDTPAPVRTGAAEILGADPASEALRELTAGWSAGWAGTTDAGARVVHVAGGAAAAIGLVCPTATRMGELSPSEALATLAWASASGGAHGRRRGMARGRFEAWWALAALAGVDEDWPLEPGELGDMAGELRWFTYTDDTPVKGWRLRVAVEDPTEGLAWAVDAGGGATPEDDTTPLTD